MKKPKTLLAFGFVAVGIAFAVLAVAFASQALSPLSLVFFAVALGLLSVGISQAVVPKKQTPSDGNNDSGNPNPKPQKGCG